MKYQVVLTDTAKQDLWDIAVRIAEQSKDSEIARNFVKELRMECHQPELLPNRVAFPNDRILKSMGYRFIVHKAYLIFYMVDEEKNAVYVMSVFHSGKDYMRVMKKFL